MMELVQYVKDEHLDRQRDQERKQANIFRRTWWKLVGMPEDSADE